MREKPVNGHAPFKLSKTMTHTNKENEEKRMRLFDMQEHPERYTDQQMEELLADDEAKSLFRDMALARMALRKAHPASVDTDEAWHSFSARHGLANGHAPMHRPMRYKVAAAVAAALLLTGMAIAAIRAGVFSSAPTTAPRKPQVEQPAATADSTYDNAANQTDSLHAKPVVFDDAELERVLSQLAAYYHTKVVYANDDARHIRIFFNWDKAKGLQHNLEILNAFERIQITEQDSTLIVE